MSDPRSAFTPLGVGAGTLLLIAAAVVLPLSCGGGGGGGGFVKKSSQDDDISDPPPDPPPPLALEIAVKETSGVDVDDWPVEVVVPLPQGQYLDTDLFRLTDESGQSVLAQFEALTRWWIQDDSIRHLRVTFLASVPAFTGPGTGIARYVLRNDADENPPPTDTPLRLFETDDVVSVITGPLKLVVQKKSFDLLNQVWLDRSGDGKFVGPERVIQPHPSGGGELVGHLPGDVERDSARTDVTVELESRGPVCAVIRVSSPSFYESPDHQHHGFTARIYAYQGSPLLRVEYQLQDSALDKGLSWPLYLESMRLNLGHELHPASATVRCSVDGGGVLQFPLGQGIALDQESHDVCNVRDAVTGQVLASGLKADGWLDVQDGELGVLTAVRHFWQAWPNAIRVEAGGLLSLELFPDWSAQWYQDTISSTGLYWLEDMQHVLKEAVLYFHPSNADPVLLERLAAAARYPPVACLPVSWYAETAANLDLDGSIPIEDAVASTDERLPFYPPGSDVPGPDYLFNWVNFRGDVTRKTSCSTGGLPYSAAFYLATGRVRDYYDWAERARGDLNVRPQWLAGYRHAQHYSKLKPTENPYCEGSWRRFDGGNAPFLDQPYLPGTGTGGWMARDDQHQWSRYMLETYLYSGDRWLSDWYEFIAEFRRPSLQLKDPFPSMAARAQGHRLDHALQAYVVTGNLELMDDIHDYVEYLRDRQLPTGHPGDGGAFQVGYLARAVITYAEEMRRAGDWLRFYEAFCLVAGYVEWNVHKGNFCFNCGSGGGPQSDGTGVSLADPQAWLYDVTGDRLYLEHLNQYIDEGIPPGLGAKPNGELDDWQGQYEGRLTHKVRHIKRKDARAPEPIVDLKVERKGIKVELKWTAPPDQDLERSLVLWSDQPISRDYVDSDKKKVNWWAAGVQVPSAKPKPGATQTFTMIPPPGKPFHAVVVTFDRTHNKSELSNQATAK